MRYSPPRIYRCLFVPVALVNGRPVYSKQDTECLFYLLGDDPCL